MFYDITYEIHQKKKQKKQRVCMEQWEWLGGDGGSNSGKTMQYKWEYT